MDLKAITDVLGVDFVRDTNALMTRAYAKIGASNEKGRDALVDLLIAMIVAVEKREGTDTEFVSRLDTCAERLRSAGMAARRQADL